MTDDKDLIAMARLAQRDGRMATGALYGDLADRIEDLIAELPTCEKYRDAYAECDRIGTQAVRDLEAKLAKAVEGLDAVVQHEASTFFGPDGEKNKRASWRGVMRKVRATLAAVSETHKIKGESHEVPDR